MPLSAAFPVYFQYISNYCIRYDKKIVIYSRNGYFPGIVYSYIWFILTLTTEDMEEKIMVITDVRVRKLFHDDGPMKAIVSITLDNQIAVHDVKVIHARDHFFIVMPSRKNPDNTYRDIVHPINAEFRAALETAVLDAYEKALADEEAAVFNADAD